MAEADAVEIVVGQGAKPGTGGVLLGFKVSDEVAGMRDLPPGVDQRSPVRHPDFLGADDLRLKIEELRETTRHRVPIWVKLGACRVFDDVRLAVKAGADVVVIDGLEGASAASPLLLFDHTGVPTLAAVVEAREALIDIGAYGDVQIVIAGGIRNGVDAAKALALGAGQLPGVPHRPLPCRCHHTGLGTDGAAGRRLGQRACGELPERHDHGDPDAGAGLRKIGRAQPGARGSALADARMRGDHRGASGGADPAVKEFVTADDIRALAEQGERELLVREHTTLTDAALDAARMHGVRLVEGGATSQAQPAGDAVAALPVTPGGLPAPALAGLVREQAAAGRREQGGSRPPAPGGEPIEGLPDIGSLQTKLLIGGGWSDAAGGETVATIDPATNHTIVDVAAARPEDIDRAVRAARDALPAWRDTAPEKRSRILLRIAELIEADRDRLARIESHDVGKPIREAALVDLPACWDPWRFYQGLVRVIDGRVLAMPTGSLDYVRKEPMGVVGMIIPWQFPLHIACRKGSAALAARNTV